MMHKEKHEFICSFSIVSTKEGWDLEDVYWLSNHQQYYSKV
jgi:hypothetical protein